MYPYNIMVIKKIYIYIPYTHIHVWTIHWPSVSFPCSAPWLLCLQYFELHPQTCEDWEPEDLQDLSDLTWKTWPKTEATGETFYHTTHISAISCQSKTMVTWVACMSCSQWRSLIAEFCNSPTALSEVTMFLTRESSPVNASQALISLSNPRIS